MWSNHVGRLSYVPYRCNAERDLSFDATCSSFSQSAMWVVSSSLPPQGEHTPCIQQKNQGTISINQETTHVRSLLTLTRFTAYIHSTAPHLHFGRCVSLLLVCASFLDWLSPSLFFSPSLDPCSTISS